MNVIRRRAKVEREAGFAQLRAEGMRFVQSACGSTWTDHNLHDPGITILEQLCYALTELVYRAEFPVADHLCGPDGQIDFDACSLHRPQDIFPCRATTAGDYRRVLLDRVAGLDDATLEAQPAQGRAGMLGVYRLTLQLSSAAAESEAARIAQARDAYRAQRNLGEDLDDEVVRVREVPCELHAEIEIGGPRDAADVLAEVYDRCGRCIAQAAQSRSLRELRAEGWAPEQIYCGPVTPNGFIVESPRAAAERDTLYLADLAAQLRQVDGVKELRRLALQPQDGPPCAGSLARRGDGWALRLRVPGAVGDERPGHVLLRRRGNAVHVGAQELRRKFDDLQAIGRAERARLRDQQAGDAADALPQGCHREALPYHSVQQHFPAVYGLGRHGLPASAGAAAQARVRQLRSYLLLFEQVIANGAAQVQHLRELFSVNGGAAQSYWWQPLDDASVPGLQDVRTETPQQLQRELYEPFDRSPRRKARALDHLLALYGETYTQNSMRQFCGHHSPDELELLLLENKAAYLKDIVWLGRHRGGGFDYGKPSWNQPDNCCGLLKRVCLLLGFRHAHSRSLTQALRRLKLQLLPAETPAPEHRVAAAEAAEAAAGAAMAPYLQPLTREQMETDLRQLQPLRRPQLSEALFRCGVHRERYRLVPRGAAVRLMLGPDEQGRWWHLADFGDEGAARRAAASLRHLLLQLQHESEGLHVVEHVLLRPISADASAHAALPLPPDFFSLRISVVLPAWTVRTHQPAFRRFAEETVRINCPSHLDVACLWLDFDAMLQFEACYEHWLALRLAQCAAAPDAVGAPDRQALDAAACRVIECLLPRPDPEADDDLVLQGHA